MLRNHGGQGRPWTTLDYKTPGQLIQALLAEKGWTQRVLAIVLNMDETGINRLVADKRSLDAPLALALEDVFHVPAEKFLEIQKSFDLAKARITTLPDPGRATRARLYGDPRPAGFDRHNPSR